MSDTEPPFSIPAAGGGTTIDWEARALAAEQALTEARAETEQAKQRTKDSARHVVQYAAERDAARAELVALRERIEAVRSRHLNGEFRNMDEFLRAVRALAAPVEPQPTERTPDD